MHDLHGQTIGTIICRPFLGDRIHGFPPVSDDEYSWFVDTARVHGCEVVPSIGIERYCTGNGLAAIHANAPDMFFCEICLGYASTDCFRHTLRFTKSV